MQRAISALQQQRYSYQPKIPQILLAKIDKLGKQSATLAEEHKGVSESIQQLFPSLSHQEGVQFGERQDGDEQISAKKGNFAVILSGGQAPGGHNVIAGLFDAIQANQPQSKLLGFCGGPAGLINGKYQEITADLLNAYRNTGGFDIIGSGRTKLETEEQFAQVEKVCRDLEVSTIVVIGGDDSNTNAALLAEYCLARNNGIDVIGCPKTIDGDLKSSSIEISFGFDSATKTFAELIGNIARDAISAKKYWHFVRLMGRSASHITLECALRCQPDIALISEEIQEQQISLTTIVERISDVIVQRAQQGKNYGLILIPEGLIEFLPGFDSLIQQLNTILDEQPHLVDKLVQEHSYASLLELLEGAHAKQLFSALPPLIQRELLAERDPHGNVHVSLIETEKLLIDLVAKQLEGVPAVKFAPLSHFFGYEGRSCFPSNFDANYCYALGRVAYLLGISGCSGHIAALRNLAQPVEQWIATGVPIISLLTIEKRHSRNKPVIRKALVDLDSAAFQRLRNQHVETLVQDNYLFPGPIQFYGPEEICDEAPLTLTLEKREATASI